MRASHADRLVFRYGRWAAGIGGECDRVASQAKARRLRRCDVRGTSRCPASCREASRGAFPCGTCVPVWHDGSGHGLERESNPQMSNPEFDALPLSYPKRRHAGIEPATCGLRRRSPVEPMSSCRCIVSGLRHAPRQCRAHRAGCEPAPLEAVLSMHRIAGLVDRQSVCPCVSRRCPHRASRCSACAPRGGIPRQRRPACGPRCPCVRAVMLRKSRGWKTRGRSRPRR